MVIRTFVSRPVSTRRILLSSFLSTSLRTLVESTVDISKATLRGRKGEETGSKRRAEYHTATMGELHGARHKQAFARRKTPSTRQQRFRFFPFASRSLLFLNPP